MLKTISVKTQWRSQPDNLDPTRTNEKKRLEFDEQSCLHNVGI